LKRYANERGIGLIGDIPIFVALDSADVWAHQELFDVQRSGRPRAVSGVPPDSFSPTGQLWGHPLYDWTAHERTGFAWWIARFRRAFEQFDAVRIDHFLGFHRCWAVPATARSAARGVWRKSPGRALFTALRDALGPVRIIAEDLGVVTPEAIALREQCGFPGMRIVQNAFGHAGHDDLPHNHPRDSVVYTGTHDNDTAVGWFAALPKGAKHGARGRDRLTARERFMRYSGSDGRAVHWDLIRLAYQSPARTAIIPMQDVLGLGGEARMNVPAVSRGNWGWRMRPGAIRTEHVRRLRELAGAFERLPCKCE
jgi:4-alpha-glucanotransferase